MRARFAVLAAWALAAAFPAPAGAEGWAAGLTATADGPLARVDRDVFPGGTVSLEAGPAWERSADFRMDDALVRAAFRWAPRPGGRLCPYAAGWLELFVLDTGYARAAAPGAGLGLGCDLSLGRRSVLSAEIGGRLGGARLDSAYAGPSFSVRYQEILRTPVLCAGIGWRMRIGSAGAGGRTARGRDDRGFPASP